MYYKKYIKYKNKNIIFNLIGGSESGGDESGGGGGADKIDESGEVIVPKIDGEETKIIIDWDDTLYPTSFIMRIKPFNIINSKLFYAPAYLDDFKFSTKSYDKEITEFLKNYFTKLAEEIRLLILNAQKYGEVIIVTNSEDGWVKDTCKLMPELLPLLDTIRIISAQDKWKHKSPVPGDWKKFEFEEIIRPFIESKKNKIIKLICIGDSIDEHASILHVASIINAIDGYTAYTKQFKFKVKPDAVELYTQVNNMANYLCNNPDKIITNLTSNNYKFLD